NDVLTSDYATAARTADGAHAVVYVPTARTVSVDTTRLQPGFSARWFDPTTGTSQAATAPYTTPGPHADGASDWVLVLDGPGTTTTAPLTTAPPTTTAPTTTPTSSTVPGTSPTFVQAAAATPQTAESAVAVPLPSV